CYVFLLLLFFFSSRRRHTRSKRDWSSDVCSSDLEIELSNNFEYILNRLSANFTTYELAEFTAIRSTYAKTMYRLLKQWRTIGKKEFKIEEFKVLLDMPKYYGPSEINRTIIKPTL